MFPCDLLNVYSAAKPQAYRPPGSRGGPAAAPRSLIDHGGSLPNVSGGVYKPAGGGNVPGMTRNQQKNQKKRENNRFVGL